MVTLSTSIICLFVVACLVSILVPVMRDKILKQLTVAPLVSGVPSLLLVVAPLAALLGLGSQFGIDAGKTLPYFAVFAVASYVVARVKIPAALRGILLLIGAVIFTATTPVEGFTIPAASTLFGLLSWKLFDSFARSEATLDDILPPVIWVASTLWMRLSLEASSLPNQEGLLLSVISVALLLRTIHHVCATFLIDDVLYFKRMVLSVTGALALLIVVMKLVVWPEMAKICILAGAGMLVTFIFSGKQEPQVPAPNTAEAAVANTVDSFAGLNGPKGLKLLFIIGILYLVASRIWGTYGLIVLAPTALVAPWSSPGQFPGFFFALRVLLQCFILSFNSNVTGINIMHAYTGAALYGGFIAIAAAVVALREVSDRKVLGALFLAGGVLVPLGSNYFLHAEPTSSFLVSATVAAVLMAAIAPSLQQQSPAWGYQNLLLLPAIMIASAMATSGLLEAGTTATVAVKTTMIGYGIGFVVALSIVGWLIMRNKAKPAPEA